MSIFPEVRIEGKSRADTQALHQNKAGTVGKAKIVIGKSFKDTPGLFGNFWCDIFNAQEPTDPKSFTKLNSDGMSSSEPNNGIAFV